MSCQITSTLLVRLKRKKVFSDSGNVLHCTALYCTVLHCTARSYIALHSPALFCIAVWVKVDGVQKSEMSFLLEVTIVPNYLCNTKTWFNAIWANFMVPFMEITKENQDKASFSKEWVVHSPKNIIVYCISHIYTTYGVFRLSKSPLLHINHIFVIS